MNPHDPKVVLLSVLFTVIMFAVAAFFARATRRRSLGVLIAAAPIVPLVVIYDTVAAKLGWWHYPSVPIGSVPLGWYVAAALWYGAALGLVGWRVNRRWATAGLVVFVVAFALVGVARDYAYSATTRLIVFGSGPVPLLADLLAYASAAIIVQLLMRWIVGPAQSDVLARTPKSGA